VTPGFYTAGTYTAGLWLEEAMKMIKGRFEDKAEFVKALHNRDRRKPLGLPLPHHRTYGSRIRRFDELNSYRGARFGSPKFVK
jgi:hypothetical protein